MYNEAISAMIDASEAIIAEMPSMKKRRAKIDAIKKDIETGDYGHNKIVSLVGDLDEAVYGYMLAMAEEMFVAGWKLRGNPDDIFKLKDVG